MKSYKFVLVPTLVVIGLLILLSRPSTSPDVEYSTHWTKSREEFIKRMRHPTAADSLLELMDLWYTGSLIEIHITSDRFTRFRLLDFGSNMRDSLLADFAALRESDSAKLVDFTSGSTVTAVLYGEHFSQLFRVTQVMSLPIIRCDSWPRSASRSNATRSLLSMSVDKDTVSLGHPSGEESALEQICQLLLPDLNCDGKSSSPLLSRLREFLSGCYAAAGQDSWRISEYEDDHFRTKSARLTFTEAVRNIKQPGNANHAFIADCRHYAIASSLDLDYLENALIANLRERYSCLRSADDACEMLPDILTGFELRLAKSAEMVPWAAGIPKAQSADVAKSRYRLVTITLAISSTGNAFIYLRFGDNTFLEW